MILFASPYYPLRLFLILAFWPSISVVQGERYVVRSSRGSACLSSQISGVPEPDTRTFSETHQFNESRLPEDKLIFRHPTRSPLRTESGVVVDEDLKFILPFLRDGPIPVRLWRDSCSFGGTRIGAISSSVPRQRKCSVPRLTPNSRSDFDEDCHRWYRTVQQSSIR